MGVCGFFAADDAHGRAASRMILDNDHAGLSRPIATGDIDDFVTHSRQA
jgi:hypothetical protein